MKISTFKQFIGDAFKSLKRNFTISLASIATVSATLFILGIFILLLSNVNVLMRNVESGVKIKVYLVDSITFSQQKDIENSLKNSNGVKNAVYQSKEDALKNSKDVFGDDKEITSGYNIENNPFPASFTVELESPSQAEKVTKLVEHMDGVDSVGNDQELVNTILSISKAVKWIGILVFVMLVGVSLFLIGNSIRIAVFSRRREIGIMKFVGATDWFIRWPFVIEGVVIGIIGAVLGNAILYFLYNVTYKKVLETFSTLQLVHPGYVTSTIIWQFILAGSFIGVVGSINALRKFLTV